MTPLAYRLVAAASLITFGFGALAFSTLALFYWRQRSTHQVTASRAFPAFTLVCGLAFLLNLAQLADEDLAWLGSVCDLITGLVPALLVHLVAEEEGAGPRWLPPAFYAGAGALAIAVAISP